MKPVASVKRDGAWKNIDSTLLVPGDLVKLKAGGNNSTPTFIAAVLIDLHRVDIMYIVIYNVYKCITAAVPADCFVNPDEQEIEVDQAAMTGESLPVRKNGNDQYDIV